LKGSTVEYWELGYWLQLIVRDMCWVLLTTGMCWAFYRWGYHRRGFDVLRHTLLETEIQLADEQESRQRLLAKQREEWEKKTFPYGVDIGDQA